MQTTSDKIGGIFVISTCFHISHDTGITSGPNT